MTEFDQFVALFPEVELPVVLSEEMTSIFSRTNEPLSAIVLKEFIEPIEGELDDTSEVIPCFRIPKTYDFHAIIYWKAELMNYQYILATFDKNGNLIDRKVIAGTISDTFEVIQSVATITEDWQIYIVSGQNYSDAQSYKASSSTANRLQLLTDGKIKDTDEE
ncbi:MAG: hypothetical protein AAFO07_09095 [Bacteroidota bacterium]